MRRPRLRALLGLVWVMEVLGLGVVMALWDTHWLPLAAVFIDWDALTRTPTGLAPSTHATASARVIAFVTPIVAFASVQATLLNQRLRLYPFSSYPMFATVRARRPFAQHLPYELVGGRIEIQAASPLAPDMQAWIDRRIQFRWMWKQRDPRRVHHDLVAVMRETGARWPELAIVRARCVLVVDRIEAYPEAARLVRRDLAVVGELTASGEFHSELGARPLAGAEAQTIEGARYELVNDPSGTSWLVR
jgi:hypothetical protein